MVSTALLRWYLLPQHVLIAKHVSTIFAATHSIFLISAGTSKRAVLPLEMDCTKAWTGSLQRFRRGNKSWKEKRNTYLTRVFLDIQSSFLPSALSQSNSFACVSSQPQCTQSIIGLQLQLLPYSIIRTDSPLPLLALLPHPRTLLTDFVKTFCEITSAVSWPSSSSPTPPFHLSI